jgi:hypothetical protein
LLFVLFSFFYLVFYFFVFSSFIFFFLSLAVAVQNQGADQLPPVAGAHDPQDAGAVLGGGISPQRLEDSDQGILTALPHWQGLRGQRVKRPVQVHTRPRENYQGRIGYPVSLQGVQHGIKVRLIVQIGVKGTQRAQQADVPPAVELVDAQEAVLPLTVEAQYLRDSGIVGLELDPSLIGGLTLPVQNHSALIMVQEIVVIERVDFLTEIAGEWMLGIGDRGSGRRSAPCLAPRV